LIIRLFIIFFALYSYGCTKYSEPLESKPLAKVGKKTLYLDEIKHTVPHYLLSADSVTVVKNFTDQWVRNQVLYEEAIRLGIHENSDVQSRIENSTKDILIGELRNQIQLNSTSLNISEEEVASFYMANKAMFVLKERHVKVRHLFALDFDAITLAREQLMAGNSWDEIVNNHATDKEYSLLSDSQLVAFSQAFSSYPKLKSLLALIGFNEVSSITIESGYYHLIQLVEDRPAGDYPEISYVFNSIKEWLIFDRSRRAFKSYEQNLLVQAEANGEIVIY